MLGFPFMLPGPSVIQNLPKGSYVIKWQEAGRVEADFVCFDVKSVIRNIYTLFSGSEIPIAGDNQEIMDLYDPTTPLPPWFSEEDLATYESLYKKSGFRFALQVLYRSSSPSMKDIEAYSAINTAKLDEAELAKSVPHNICLEVPFQV
ncbi:uncharacterized protein [Glycine max]|nr:uncharacterized protein LOC100808407 [Glycine max]